MAPILTRRTARPITPGPNAGDVAEPLAFGPDLEAMPEVARPVPAVRAGDVLLLGAFFGVMTFAVVLVICDGLGVTRNLFAHAVGLASTTAVSLWGAWVVLRRRAGTRVLRAADYGLARPGGTVAVPSGGEPAVPGPRGPDVTG